MRFKARLDDPESRAFWESVDRGARAYDEYPSWKKGVLGGFENADGESEEPANVDADGPPSENSSVSS